MTARDVFLFTEYKQAEKEFGKENVKNLLGAKGANLGELSLIEGVPVPKGFTITSKVCKEYLAADPPALPDGIWDQVNQTIAKLEEETEKKFGDAEKPLIVSCRPGPATPMPRMLLTLFNIGYCDQTVAALCTSTENPRFVHATYRKFLREYGTAVMKIAPEKFDELYGAFRDTSETEELEKFENQVKEMMEQESGEPFPQNPIDQLKASILAVFESWNSEQAQEFRTTNNIPDDMFTAVNVQVMVYGNFNESSGAGLAFSRNPANGDSSPSGNYLPQMSGLDLINKTKQPQPYQALEAQAAQAYEKFGDVMRKIETHFKDIQKIDFTVENNELWVLQTRSSRRNTHAAYKILVDMTNDTILTKEEAIESLQVPDVEAVCVEEVELTEEEKEQLQQQQQQPPQKLNLEEEQELQQLLTWADEIRLSEGLRKDQPNGPNHGLNIRANADTIEEIAKSKNLGADGVGLLRTEKMFLTEERIPIVRRIILADTEEESKKASAELIELQTAELAPIFEALNGTTTVIRLADLSIGQFLPDVYDLIAEIEQIKARIEYGIAVEEEEEQKEEPPKEEEGAENTENNENGDGENEGEQNPEEPPAPKPPKLKPIEIKQKLLEKVMKYQEENPKLGYRGIRLLLAFPELLKAHLRALFDGATNAQNGGQVVTPELLVPFITTPEEFSLFQKLYNEALQDYAREKETECPVTFKIGAEIGTANAAILADKIAKTAEFLSFDQISLTEGIYGYGREEADEGFMGQYKEQQVVEESPFLAFDCDGVGKIVELAIKKAREANPEIQTGLVTFDKASELNSFDFLHKIGLNYISCRPIRLPVARVVAAKVVCSEKEKEKEPESKEAAKPEETIQPEEKSDDDSSSSTSQKEKEPEEEDPAPITAQKDNENDETLTTETEETDED
ncbi:pyruvate, phosphate dikinase [Tritrichomonas foetus]|uniref:Pyruvate, phosphate dikinase n=1 Tax=Tritrichomonas foetus TaxID=1144522 RepID=A0A1J4KI07_9EUKA|nr:pyruvate, phosphate dikinase [Tritrichomonas foetus]|eukprot:OHT09286.1 pyruvate, phosphate dikinase [Tritrichomonas foetus]